MMQPVIGISTLIEQATWSYWDDEAALVPTSYIDAVQRAEGMAILLPPDQYARGQLDQLLELIDGLIIAGGADIDPSNYGADRHEQTDGCLLKRDHFELELVRKALQRDIPILGICRGMQMINVATGGTLCQHLPERFGHHEHRRVLGSFDGADHNVKLQPGSLIARAAGEMTHSTKSHHHQGVDKIGTGLEVTGWAAIDDLPEAIEAPGKRFVLGVQWHPEVDSSSGVVAALVEAAKERMSLKE